MWHCINIDVTVSITYRDRTYEVNRASMSVCSVVSPVFFLSDISVVRLFHRSKGLQCFLNYHVLFPFVSLCWYDESVSRCSNYACSALWVRTSHGAHHSHISLRQFTSFPTCINFNEGDKHCIESYSPISTLSKIGFWDWHCARLAILGRYNLVRRISVQPSALLWCSLRCWAYNCDTLA